VAAGDADAAAAAMEHHRATTLAGWRAALARAGAGAEDG
jgi:hypothetical protein